MNQRGILLVISGFAGSGKGTLMKELMKRYDNYALSISATTRQPREGEAHGREYFFMDKEKFEAMIERDEFLEHACYVGNYYGTPKAYVEEQLASGKDVILEIETQGALIIKKKCPDALLLFVMPPSVPELYRRLVERGTETPEVIASRMRRGRQEAQDILNYDYLVVNDNIDACVERLHATIESSHFATKRNLKVIDNIEKEFDEFLK
ncbi:MAG TPA: guanylate kinase [Lachnospiraceae bacterium]|jgi:guanylate kinase|nr:guanylate kinase [Lachnospiraceae bacterium]